MSDLQVAQVSKHKGVLALVPRVCYKAAALNIVLHQMPTRILMYWQYVYHDSMCKLESLSATH